MRNAPDKNPFKGVSDLLSRAAPARRNAHFIAYVIDIVLVFIVSYLLFLGGRAIVSSSEAYKRNYANYEAEITYYQDMLVEAHIAEYIDRDNNVLVDDEDLCVKTAISQIILSYSHDNPSSPEFFEDPSIKLKEIYNGDFYSDCFTEASFDNDYVSKFFIDYIPLHNENNKLIDLGNMSSVEYTIYFYKKHAIEHEKLRFVYDVGGNSIPYLRMDIANEIYKYLVRADGNNRDDYDAFIDFYTSMLNDTQDIIFKSESYQNGHYQDYLSYRQKTTQAIGWTLLISIFLAYYLAVFLPQMIFKDGRSIGRILLRLASINTDKSETELWKVILRSIFTAISSVYIAFFLVLLPPFNGASMILYLPFITIGTFDITILNIIIVVFALAAINGITMLLTHEKRNLVDVISKTIVVDVTMLDEPDYDERDEANL